MKLSEYIITFRCRLSETACKTVRDTIKFAKQNNASCKLLHSEVLLDICPDSKFEDVIREYYEKSHAIIRKEATKRKYQAQKRLAKRIHVTR